MNAADQYLQAQIQPMLQPGEQVLHTAFMRRQPGLLMQILLVGGLLLYLLTKYYFVVVTNRRIILVRTKAGMFGGPKLLNLGVEQWDIRSLVQVTTSGIAANRSMTFHMHQGPPQTLRIWPSPRHISGTKIFFDQFPGFVASGQLAQIAGAPPQGMLAPGQPQMQQPQMQQQQPQMQQQQQQQPQYQQQMQQQQQQQYQQQMQQQQQQQMQQQQQPMYPPQAQMPSVLQPGQPVLVTAPDGNRYPGTLMQAANGQYLCQMPNGQGHWFPAHAVTPRA